MGPLRGRMTHDLERAGDVSKTLRIDLKLDPGLHRAPQRSPSVLGPDDMRAWIDVFTTSQKIGPQLLVHSSSVLSGRVPSHRLGTLTVRTLHSRFLPRGGTRATVSRTNPVHLRARFCGLHCLL